MCVVGNCVQIYSKNNVLISLQFYAIAETYKTELGCYYEAFVNAPKYLLLSGGPTRMPEIVEAFEKMLVSITLPQLQIILTSFNRRMIIQISPLTGT